MANITIDDTYGDPTTGAQIVYSPPGFWNGPTCKSCTAKPDPKLAFNQTWHDTSYIPALDPANLSLSAEVSFCGTAVYIYGILYYGPTLAWATTDLQFLIDGQHVGSYPSPGNTSGAGATGFHNALYFAKQGLSFTNHTLTILNGANKGPQISLILLDRIVYTQEQSTSGNNHSGAIIGSVLGAIAGLAILAALFFYRRRHRSKGLRPRWGTALSNGTTPIVPAPPFLLPLSSSSVPLGHSAATTLVGRPPSASLSSPTSPPTEASESDHSRDSTYGGSEKGSEGTSSRMESTTRLLVAEIRRLREENERLRPPPYLH